MDAVQCEGLLPDGFLSLLRVADFPAVLQPLGAFLAHKAAKQFVKHFSLLVEISN